MGSAKSKEGSEKGILLASSIGKRVRSSKTIALRRYITTDVILVTERLSVIKTATAIVLLASVYTNDLQRLPLDHGRLLRMAA